jgi:hypothetical protein
MERKKINTVKKLRRGGLGVKEQRQQNLGQFWFCQNRTYCSLVLDHSIDSISLSKKYHPTS